MALLPCDNIINRSRLNKKINPFKILSSTIQISLRCLDLGKLQILRCLVTATIQLRVLQIMYTKWLEYGTTVITETCSPGVHQVSQGNLRNNSNFIVPRSRTNLYDKSFIPLATREWNSLPDVMKSAPSLNSFK